LRQGRSGCAHDKRSDTAKDRRYYALTTNKDTNKSTDTKTGRARQNERRNYAPPPNKDTSTGTRKTHGNGNEAWEHTSTGEKKTGEKKYGNENGNENVNKARL
ncbi:MAG TPA: hypothetical protein DEO38_02195, partial [Bacteroidales bacterium]|nr:hypothetical protein [Bacteroidales bacterium]